MQRNTPIFFLLLSSAVLLAQPDLRQSVAADYEQNLHELFLHFHENPELSHREFNTSKRLADEIRAFGYTVTEGVGGTGVVAVLENGTGPVVMIRADMDGLAMAAVCCCC